MSRLRPALLAITFLSAVIPPEVNAQAIGACYDITVGEWAPVESTAVASLPRPRSPDLTGDSVIYSLPPRVQFQNRPSRIPNSFVLAVPENSLQVPHSMLFWYRYPDSLRLVVSTGFAGTTSRLSAVGEDWVGFAQTFSDVVGLLRYRRPIRLVRVECTTPPPVPASSDRPLLRGIELQSGGRLILGEMLPVGVPTRTRPSGAVTVEASGAGLWAGADTIIARLDSAGRVHHVDLLYPEGHDLSGAVSALAGRYGAGRALGGHVSVVWSNRTTTLIMNPGGRQPRVLLYDPRFR